MRYRSILLLSLALIPCLPTVCHGQNADVVRGVVRDARGGEPLARVEVELQPGAERRITDSEGRFRFTGARPGDYVLRASSVGYRMASSRWLRARRRSSRSRSLRRSCAKPSK